MFVSSLLYFFFLFKQKTAYEMRISDWSSDVCSSDLGLARLPGVELHASCGEYAAAYAALLDHARPLPVHPCFLGDWRKRPARRTGGGEDRILLYVGEVKQEKGFLALPQVAEDLASRMPERSRLVIQFVSVRNAAGRQVLNELKGLAIRLPQIELHHGFWSDEHLHEALAASSVFYMNYAAEAYAHQTIGLLWLEAWYRLPVAVPPGTWLEREAGCHGGPLISNEAARKSVGSGVSV